MVRHTICESSLTQNDYLICKVVLHLDFYPTHQNRVLPAVLQSDMRCKGAPRSRAARPPPAAPAGRPCCLHAATVRRSPFPLRLPALAPASVTSIMLPIFYASLHFLRLPAPALDMRSSVTVPSAANIMRESSLFYKLSINIRCNTLSHIAMAVQTLTLPL